jgi:hypothetical protein
VIETDRSSVARTFGTGGDEGTAPAVHEWLGGRPLPWLGSNAGTSPVPFQQWHHFKEAFAPELVARALSLAKEGAAVFDPFGGSGTTALTCQFLGTDVTTVEVNPFLADVIRAKLARHDADELRAVASSLVEAAAEVSGEDVRLPPGAPSTLVEPGVNGRYVFHEGSATQIRRLAAAIGGLQSQEHQAFFRACLGGVLVGLSNVTVNGKGRRYRRGWADRPELGLAQVNSAFLDRTQSAADDVRRFAARRDCQWAVYNEDVRQFKTDAMFDLTVCSPPYPNSFDYTDVYNLELWMLGYLGGSAANKDLRRATLSSHVQINREFLPPPPGSPSLDAVLLQLEVRRGSLWNRNIPEMIGSYFAELLDIFLHVSYLTNSDGELWIVVGDSQYQGVLIPVAGILRDLLTVAGWDCVNSDDTRSMRSSAQQGGRRELAETLLILRRS